MTASATLTIKIAGYDAQVTRNSDGGMTVEIHAGFLGPQLIVITGDEWRALVAFQPVVSRP